MKIRPLLASVLCVLVFPAVASAQWISSGVPVSATAGDQQSVALCSDGSGGAILTFEDYRSDANGDVYAQRISSSGSLKWTANGVPVVTASGSQYQPQAVSDGASGAIITWMDFRNGNYDVYAQRINASGTPLWTANGVVVSNAAADQTYPRLIADGAGGAIITWTDERAGNIDIYVQKVNSSGVAQWTANGVALCTATGNQLAHQIATDGAGGAIVTWADLRAGAYSDLYAQRIGSNGVTQWTLNGLPVCTVIFNQSFPTIISDGANGAVITWMDSRTGADDRVYVQRVSGAGVALWTAGGVFVSPGPAQNPKLVPDGSNGAIIVWNDPGLGDISAQRVTGAGNLMWRYTGVSVVATAQMEDSPNVVSDGANGAIVTWNDPRSINFDLFAQRVDINGNTRWATNGVQITANEWYEQVPTPLADGSGNVIVGYYAQPNNADMNVYAARIDGRYGYWGKPDPVLSAVKDVPADNGGKVRVEWYGSTRDVLGQQTIQYYTIWRAIDQAAFVAAVSAGVPDVKLTDPATKLTGKAVRHDRPEAVDYYWELIGQQDATYRYAYSFTASTNFDSTAANPATHRFQIVAHHDQYTSWPSNILAGRSVDNVAPPAPLFLTAQRSGALVKLKWNGVHVPDLDKYTVYRATSTGVTAIPANFLASNVDTVLTDSSAPASALYYIVTASDIHQNQGLKSNEAAVGATTGAGNLPPVSALTVMQNYPNPFTGETQLNVGLPVKSDVRVEIYDVAGKRVRNVLVPAQAKGWNTLRISARDDRGTALASGVYFFRVHANAETVTKKMVIAR